MYIGKNLLVVAVVNSFIVIPFFWGKYLLDIIRAKYKNEGGRYALTYICSFFIGAGMR